MAKLTKEKVTNCLKGSALTLATLAGVIGGVIFGLALRTREEKWTEREIMYVSYVGKLFLRMLKALILPLIVPSLIAAVGALDMSISGKVGGRAVGYYMSTTVIAVILGIILVSVIHPGRPGVEGDDEITKVGESRNVTAVDTLLDLARNLCPPNLVQATIQQYRTVLTYPGDTVITEKGETRDPNDLYTWKISGEFTNGTNILGLVFFAGNSSRNSDF